MTKKKIAIIEDMPLLNSMMQKLLSDHFEIVSVSNSALDMMRICDTYIPDLVLTDIVTKDGINGIVYGGKVKNKFGNKIKVLAITGVPEISFLNEAKKNNLDGLIYKNLECDILISNINQVLDGYTLFPENYNYDTESDKLKKLSNKELSILKLLCEGLERETIANKLNISIGTLKNYISSILTKMEFDSISRLQVYCVKNGYIVPDLKSN